MNLNGVLEGFLVKLCGSQLLKNMNWPGFGRKLMARLA